MFAYINSLVLSFDYLGVVPMSLVFLNVWLLLYTLYKSVFQALLARMAVTERERKKLVATYWNLCFSGATVLVVYNSVEFSLSDLSVFLNRDELTEKNVRSWTAAEPGPSLRLKLSYVILSGYYLNSVSQILLCRGLCNYDCVAAKSFLVFFVSSSPLGCIPLAMAVVGIVNAGQFCVEVSRLLCSLGRVNSSARMKKASSSVLLFHGLMWLTVYMDFFVRYIYYALVHVYHQQVFPVFLLFALSFVASFVFCLSNDPWMRLLHILQNGGRPTLECLLFEEDLEEFLVEEEEKKRAGGRWPSSPQDARRAAARTRLTQVYRNVKCYMILKRKLNTIRSRIKERSALDKDPSLPTGEVRDVGPSSPDAQLQRGRP